MAMGVYPYFREIDSHQDTVVTMSGKKVLMFGSNSYMGLTYDKRIVEAAINATKKYGTGCAGSRFLNGTLDLHIQLEHELAEFVGKDEALVYSTGFTVNEGVVSCLTGRNDYILGDDRDHASIVDGRRLSYSTFLHYKHNDMADLERELKRCRPEAIKLIVTDGLFSMEGDLAKLPEIVELKKKYNASILVDEAHGIGVFGRNGRGTCDHFGVTDDVDLIMGTFSKSLASIGGFIASDKDTINWLRHNSRTYIFSASNTLQPQQLQWRLCTSYSGSLSVRKTSGRLQTMLLSSSRKLDLRSVIQKALSFRFMFMMLQRHSKLLSLHLTTEFSSIL